MTATRTESAGDNRSNPDNSADSGECLDRGEDCAEYRFGSVEVTAEFRESRGSTIEYFRDVVSKYRFLGSEVKEHLYAVFLTAGNEVIGDKLISIGTCDSCHVDVADIARTAVLANAAAVIVVHNHPSGKAEATEEDVESTRELRDGLDLLGISLLDHVIVAEGDEYSMKLGGEIEF